MSVSRRERALALGLFWPCCCQLFDLQADPEELHDRAADPACAAVLQDMEAALRRICAPEAVDALAKADQRALVERLGGPAVAATMGAGGATPVPSSITAH